MMTSEKASIAPTDRSNTPAVSGMSTARPRMAMTTWSPKTILNVVVREERVGDPQPEEHEDQGEQVQDARLAEAGEAEGAAGGAGATVVVIEPS